MIKNLPESTRVNCQTCNPSHEIGITPYKEIKKKTMKPNSQLTNVEGWIWKKDRLKKTI